jgi:hypothetical protein
MVRHLFRPVIVAAILLSPATALAQSEVPLKPVLKQGDEFAYSIGMVLDVSQKMGEGQPAQITSLKAGSQIRMKVLEVSADGSAKLEGHFERAMVQAPIGDQKVGFEWPAAALPDDAAPVAKLGDTLEKATLSIEVDAEGNASVVSGLEKFADAASKIDLPDDRYQGFFTNEKLGNALTPIFKLDGAWKATRVVGKGWQTTETIALPPAGAIEMVSDFVVVDADSDVVNCGAQIAMSLKRPENPADDVATVSLEPTSTGATKIVYNRHRMLLQFRKAGMTIDTKWSLGGVNVEQTQVSVLNLRLVEN